jgi:hypothetical protein
MKMCIQKGLNFGLTVGFFNMIMPYLTALSVKQFLIKKSANEMEHPPYSPDFALNGFWLFPKLNSALKGQRFQDVEDVKKYYDDTENYPTTGVPKTFPTVATSLV